MSKELEALENLTSIALESDCERRQSNWSQTPLELKEIIETALKDYERLLKLRKTAEWADEKLQTKKKLKALDILKEYIHIEEDENHLYWLCGAFGSVGITKETYDSLKEELL